MPQPVAPEQWYFQWSSACGICESVIRIEGPGGRIIQAGGYFIEEYQYVTDTYLPEDALGPWFWRVFVSRPLGSNVSETRTFFVQSAAEFRLYFPSFMHNYSSP
jgi:hypothetical protein